MFARFACAFFCLVSTTAAIEITADTTIDENSPRASYTVKSGTLTVDGATTNDLWIEPGGSLAFNDGATLGRLGAGGTTTINGGDFRGEIGLGGTTDVYAGTFHNEVAFGGGSLRIHDGQFPSGIVALDANCCGTIDVYGGTFSGITSGVVDGYGGAYAFNIHGGNFADGVSRGFGSETTINVFGVGFETTQGFYPELDPIYPYVRVTGYLEDGNYFDFMSFGRFRSSQPISGDFYVLHETFRSVLPGDANDDGSVDLADLNAVRNNFGGSGQGDTNGDGIVDLEDLNSVRNHFGEFLKRPPVAASQHIAASAVPEPNSLILGLICAMFGACVYLLLNPTR